MEIVLIIAEPQVIDATCYLVSYSSKVRHFVDGPVRVNCVDRGIYYPKGQVFKDLAVQTEGV